MLGGSIMAENWQDKSSHEIKCLCVSQIPQNTFFWRRYLTWPRLTQISTGQLNWNVMCVVVCACVQWEMFSIPELENFLTILTREESEQLDRLRTRYFRLRVHLLNRARDLLGVGHWTTQCPSLSVCVYLCMYLCLYLSLCVCIDEWLPSLRYIFTSQGTDTLRSGSIYITILSINVVKHISCLWSYDWLPPADINVNVILLILFLKSYLLSSSSWHTLCWEKLKNRLMTPLLVTSC